MIFSSAQRYYLLFFVLGLAWPRSGWSQTAARFTISGTVRGGRGETLPGASVAVPALGTGTAADSLGHYALSLPAGHHQLVIAFIGYQQITREVNLTKNQRLSLNLEESGNELGEVVVEGSVTLEQKLKTTQMGVEHLSIKEAKLLPALFGEVDILKTLQLKPGVQSGGEGTSGLFVRGGSSDQNLVLLDNICLGCFRCSTPMPCRAWTCTSRGFRRSLAGGCRRWWMLSCARATASTMWPPAAWA